MYREFIVLSITTSLFEKKVRVEFSKDVNADTVTRSTLVMNVKETGHIVSYDIHVRRNIVELEFLDWPTPNTEYMLKVQRGITSIVDDELPDSLQRDIIFKSEITSVAEVLSPADHEEITAMEIAWKEVQLNPSQNLVNSFYIEIARENVFYNIVRETMIHDKTNVTLFSLESGQYYLRIRAQRGEQYGRWSDIVTFLVKNEANEPDPIFDENEPIYEEELVVVIKPQSGETPSSFIIQFNSEIDPSSVEEIIVVRRTI